LAREDVSVGLVTVHAQATFAISIAVSVWILACGAYVIVTGIHAYIATYIVAAYIAACIKLTYIVAAYIAACIKLTYIAACISPVDGVGRVCVDVACSVGHNCGVGWAYGCVGQCGVVRESAILAGTDPEDQQNHNQDERWGG
jgi:hypothetical protein